jgi:hypothetical protein
MIMSAESHAWVWSQYQGVISERKAEISPGSESQRPSEENVEKFKPRLASVQDRLQEKAAPARVKYGYVLAVAVLAGLFFPMFAMILLAIAALLIYTGKEPKKAREFFESIPAGAYLNKALAYIDSFLN